MSAEHSESRGVGIPTLVKASVDSLSLHRQNPEDFTLFASITASNLKAAFPQELSNSRLQEANLDLYSQALYLGVAMNDALDIDHFSRTSGVEANPQELYLPWRAAYQKVNQAIDSYFPESKDRERQRAFFLSYQRETVWVERHVQTNPPKDIEKVLSYRKLVNSIGLVHTAQVFLPRFEAKLDPIPTGNLNWKTLEQKYAWLDNPQNQDERKLAMLLSVIMGLQVVDDTIDYEIDKKLGLSTIATVSAGCYGEDWKKNCQTAEKGYFDKANELGMTKAAIFAQKATFVTLKKAMNKMPHKVGGKRERIFAEA